MSRGAGLRAALRDFRRPRLWLGIWLSGWLLCITLSLIPPPDIGVDLPSGDKLGHFLVYATLSAWSILIFARRRDHWRAAAALFLLGVAMELAQGLLTSTRLMDSRDVLANTLGVLGGQLLAFTGARMSLLNFDRRRFG